MEEKTKKTIRKTLKISSYVFLGIAIFMIVFAILSNFFMGEDKKGLFGIKSYIVLSDSMSATDFSAGDLIVTKTIETKDVEKEIKVGDIITFYYDMNKDGKLAAGEMVTHKVWYIGVLEDGNGNSVGKGIITYSTTSGEKDNPISYSNVIGEYSFSVPKVGYVVEFLQSTVGFFVCIFTPLAIMVILQAVSTAKVIKQGLTERRETLEIQKREYAQSALDEQERLRAELEALKAQMAQAQNAQPTVEPPTEQPPTEE
ncbi:MAG: hypothetical protein J6V68_01195 [Clostridia bacterium]|nr:hypothetical protein [Clostridia bacterium]